MDPLSDVLAMLEVDGAISSRFEGRGSWAFRFPAYGAQIKFGMVLAGPLRLWIEGDADVLRLETGDLYLLTHGRPFCTASLDASKRNPAPILQDGVRAWRDHRSADGVVRFGPADAGPAVSLASGRFAFGGEAGDLLLRHLPPLIHLRAHARESRPLAGLLELLRYETGAERPGASLAQRHLAGLVLVQALRIHLERSNAPEGWLGAMADARIGQALACLHGDLAQRWTVASLAAAAGMSRTAFATRFKRLTGTTPLDYLAGWRMTVARGALRGSDDGIAGIAERVGYLSETAFSAAFRRATGQSPGRFRQAAREAAPRPGVPA